MCADVICVFVLASRGETYGGRRQRRADDGHTNGRWSDGQTDDHTEEEWGERNN